MMIVISVLLGAGLGAWRAKKRNGNRLDMLQYGAVYALIFALVAMFLAIMIDRVN